MNELVGAWELVSFEATAPDGAVSYPFGPDAIGLLVYTDSGHMSVAIAEAGRPSFTSESRLSGTDDGFCQNSALTMKLGRPKYMHDPCI